LDHVHKYGLLSLFSCFRMRKDEMLLCAFWRVQEAMFCHCCVKVKCKDNTWQLKYGLADDSEVSHPVVGEGKKVAVDGREWKERQ
jgi:hypothetical protein